MMNNLLRVKVSHYLVENLKIFIMPSSMFRDKDVTKIKQKKPLHRKGNKSCKKEYILLQLLLYLYFYWTEYVHMTKQLIFQTDHDGTHVQGLFIT